MSTRVGGIPIGEVAAVDVTTEVVDIVYGGFAQCSDCGPANDGTKWIYALQQTAGGSSAVNGKVLYSVDYGATWSTSTITGLAIGSLVTAIDVVGQYLVVVSKTELAYYVSQINAMTGVPGAWTKVQTGFVAAKGPNDLFVESPTRVYFVGDGGYIYVSTDILSGVSVLSAGGVTVNNLLRIHGGAGVLLITGATNTTLKSTNRGITWAATAGTVTGTNQAVSVNSSLHYYVGTAAGTVFYTENGGTTWTQLVLPGAALTGIHDIVFPNPSVGYIAATRTGPAAALFATVMGGALWGENNTSRLPGNLPTFARPNRLATPPTPDLQTASNNLAIAGLGGNFMDGIVLVGASPVL